MFPLILHENFVDGKYFTVDSSGRLTAAVITAFPFRRFSFIARTVETHAIFLARKRR